MSLFWCGWVLLTALAASAPGAEEFPVRPYVDPVQLDVPWPKHSFYKQPWRGFLETKSGADFLAGIGINYNAPDNHELAVRLLAETGFKAFRIEIGWGGLRWDESGFNNEERTRRVLALCREHGIRPTILLNAHHGVPCPTKFFKTKLRAAAAKGSRSVMLDEIAGIVPGRSGLSRLTGYWAAEAIITSVNSRTGECELSKPLPKDMAAGAEVSLATLKYLPLYPVGSREFEETAAGWLRYVLLATKLVREAGVEAFDVEIWNELSFGSNFTSINHYYNPPLVQHPKDFLREGGPAWELAARTIEAVKREHPGARCIWGFSNTTFFHTPVDKLPPGTDGQSYHPYGTGTRKFPAEETHCDHPDFNLEGFTPSMEMRMPEGWAHTFTKTECLMRLLNPVARQTHPAGAERFFHYMTEHGVAPPECGVKDETGAWALKAKCALRSFCLWLNKGVDTLEYYCAWDRGPTGMGLMPAELPKLAADAKFEDVATPAMMGMRNLTRAFAGSVPLKTTTPLQIEVVALGKQEKIFDGDAGHPSLWHRDVFAALPFQVSERKFIVAAYVMTCDINQPMPEEHYQLTIRGLAARPGTVRFYDPLADRQMTARVMARDRDAITVELAVSDCPRLLVIEAP